MALPVKAQRIDPEGDRQHSRLGVVGTVKILECFQTQRPPPLLPPGWSHRPPLCFRDH